MIQKNDLLSKVKKNEMMVDVVDFTYWTIIIKAFSSWKIFVTDRKQRRAAFDERILDIQEHLFKCIPHL
jgi:hypothetical protein